MTTYFSFKNHCCKVHVHCDNHNVLMRRTTAIIHITCGNKHTRIIMFYARQMMELNNETKCKDF